MDYEDGDMKKQRGTRAKELDAADEGMGASVGAYRLLAMFAKKARPSSFFLSTG